MISQPLPRVFLLDHPNAPGMLLPDLRATRRISSFSMNDRRKMALQALSAMSLAGEFELWPTRRSILRARARANAGGPQFVFAGFPVDLGRLSERMGGARHSASRIRDEALHAVARVTGLPLEEFRPEEGPGFFLDRSAAAILKSLDAPPDRVTARNFWCYRWEELPQVESGEIVYCSAEVSVGRRLGGALCAGMNGRGKRSLLVQAEELRCPECDLLVVTGNLGEAILDEAESCLDRGAASILLIGSFPPGWSPPGPPLGPQQPLASSLALTGVSLAKARQAIRAREGRFDPRIAADRQALTDSAMKAFEGPAPRFRRGRPIDPVFRLLSLCPEGLPEDFILSMDDLDTGMLAAGAVEGRFVRDEKGRWRLPRPPRLHPHLLHGRIAELFEDSDPRSLLYRSLASAAGAAEKGNNLDTATGELQAWMRRRLDNLEEQLLLDLTASLVPGALGAACDLLRLEGAIAALDLALARELLETLPGEERSCWELWIDLEDRGSSLPGLEDTESCLEKNPRVVAECAIHDLRKAGGRTMLPQGTAETLLGRALERIPGTFLGLRYSLLRVAATNPDQLFDERWASTFREASPELEKLLLHKRALALARTEKWKEAGDLLGELIRREKRPGPSGILFLDLAEVLAGSPGEVPRLLRSLRLLESAGFRNRPHHVLFNIAMNEIEALKLERAASRLEKLDSTGDIKLLLARAQLALARGDLDDFETHLEELRSLDPSGSGTCWLLGVKALLDGDFEAAENNLGRGGEDAEPWLSLLHALQGKEVAGALRWDPWAIGELAALVARQRRFGRVRINKEKRQADTARLLHLSLADHLLRDRHWLSTGMRSELADALDASGMPGWARRVEADTGMDALMRSLALVLENGSFDVLSENAVSDILRSLQLEGLIVAENTTGREILHWGKGKVTAQMGRSALLLKLCGGNIRPSAAWKLMLAILDMMLRPSENCGGLQISAGPMGILGASPVIEEMRENIARVAPSGLAVLLEGETGVGKDLAARAIHRLSGRPGAFVTVNVAAVPETLFEAELYGVLRGAYTGANRDRPGLVEEAEGGTLFLDEIGDLAPANQVKLLRFLESGEVRRVGSGKARKVDVRVVAATHRRLEDMVEQGRFREDLYYRIVSARIRVPALRERGSDILVLKEHFADNAILKEGLARARWSPEAEALLMRHRWKGNVRELRRVVEHALLAARGRVVLPEHLPFEKPAGRTAVRRWNEAHHQLRVELIRGALERSGGSQAAAARELGLTRQTLLYHIRKLGLD